MPRIESSITINGDIDHVYGMAKNIEAFPEFMPDVKSIKVLERSEDGSRTVSEWVGIVKQFKTTVHWIEEDIWDDAARTCNWSQVEGDYKSYSGRWVFTWEDGAVRFDSVLDFEYDVPLIGGLIKNLIAKLMRENLDNMLLAIKTKVEQG